MFDHFNFLAPIYDRVIQPKTPEKMISLMDLSASLNILDVGGGTGRISQYFVDQVEQVIVADLAFDMLSVSLQKNGLLQVNSPSEKLPFPKQTFDRIIMVDALHHVYDQQQTANELWRILRKGDLKASFLPFLTQNPRHPSPLRWPFQFHGQGFQPSQHSCVHRQSPTRKKASGLLSPH